MTSLSAPSSSSSSALSSSSSSSSSSPSLSANAISPLDEKILKQSELLKQDPRNINAMVVRGCHYATQEKWQEALIDFNKAIAIGRKSSDTFLAYYQRGGYYFNKNDISRAYADIFQAQQIAENNPDSVSQRTKNNIDQLMNKINVQKNSTPAPDKWSSGGCREGSLDVTASEKSHHEMVGRREKMAADPRAVAMENHAKFEGDIALFLEDCFERMKVAENDYALRYLRVQGMMAHRNFAVAVSEMDDIIAANQTNNDEVNRDLYFIRSLAQYGVGQIDKAIADIIIARRMALTYGLYAIVDYLLAWEKGDSRVALSNLREAFDLGQEEFAKYRHFVLDEHLTLLDEYSSTYFDNTLRSAFLCFMFGRFDQALAKYSHVLEHAEFEGSDYLEALIGNVKCKGMLGDRKMAEKHYLRALEINPNHPELKFLKEYFSLPLKEGELKGPRLTPD